MTNELIVIPAFIRKLMPHASDEELSRAADNFRGYIALVLRIHERIKREKDEHDSPDQSGCATLSPKEI